MAVWLWFWPNGFFWGEQAESIYCWCDHLLPKGVWILSCPKWFIEKCRPTLSLQNISSVLPPKNDRNKKTACGCNKNVGLCLYFWFNVWNFWVYKHFRKKKILYFGYSESFQLLFSPLVFWVMLDVENSTCKYAVWFSWKRIVPKIQFLCNNKYLVLVFGWYSITC